MSADNFLVLLPRASGSVYIYCVHHSGFPFDEPVWDVADYVIRRYKPIHVAFNRADAIKWADQYRADAQVEYTHRSYLPEDITPYESQAGRR